MMVSGQFHIRITPGEITPITHWTGDLVAFGSCLSVVAQMKIPFLPARNQILIVYHVDVHYIDWAI